MLIKNFSSQQMSLPTDNIIIEICFFLVWCGLSVTANSTVSITANSIISGILAIFILIINTLILMIPAVYPSLPDYTTYVMGIKVTYTFQQKYQIDFNLSTIPILLITGASAIMATVKSYWVKKYNNGEEIKWKSQKPERK